MEPELAPISLSPTSVDNQAQAPAPINLAVGTQPAQIPAPPVAKARADKAAIGLNGVLKDKTPMQMYQDIASGREQELRESATATDNFNRYMAKQEAITQYAVKKGSPLLPEEVQAIIDPFSRQGQARPDDVIEKAYANKFVSSANTAATYMQGTVMDDANRELPGLTQRTQERASDVVTKMEFARTMSQDVGTEIHNQGWVPYLWDQAKTMLQPYNEWKMRGLNPNVGSVSGGILLGDNMKAQADELLGRPLEEYKAGLKAIVTGLRKDNPTLAEQFLEYVQGASTNDRRLQNVFTLMAPFDAASVAGLGKTALRKVDVWQRTERAMSDIVKAAEKVDQGVPTKAVMAEGSGNVTEAGVQRATDNITKTLDGSLDPIQDVKEKLTSNFRLDGDILDTNPGTLSREQLTRLKDGFYAFGNNFVDTIMNAMRVNRTPIPLATEDAVRAYQASSRGLFPGLDGALADIGSPRLEVASNTYHVPFSFTNLNGKLFSDPETALAFAKREGFADARIAEAVGDVERTPAQWAGTKKDLSNKPVLEQKIADALEDVKAQKAIARKGSKATDEERLAAREKVRLGQKILEESKSKLKEIEGRLTWTDAVIEQQGVGYKITVWKPYREVEDSVRGFLIDKSAEGKFIGKGASTSSAEGVTSWKNAALGWIRGADDTLSVNETMQRKIATYTQSVLRKAAEEESKYIENIATGAIRKDPVTGAPLPWYKSAPKTFLNKVLGKRQMFQEFNETLDYARKAVDPTTGDPGYFFKTPGELEDHYQRTYQRMPTFPEHQAYFSHVKLVEGNRVLSEISEFRNRARIGAEQHQIFLQGPDKTQVSSGFFDAIHQKTFPGGSDQILVLGGRQGQEKLYNLGANEIPPKELERMREHVQTGQAKVLRIYDPDAHPLKDFSEVANTNRVRYVLTYNSESKPLDFNHVNRRGGGHFEYDYDFYVKQAKVINESAGSADNDKRRTFNHTYVGDNTFMPISNRGMGKDIVAKMNEMNGYFKADNMEAAQALSRQLGIDWEDMKGWYKGSRDPKGTFIPPRINPDEPFYVVPKNKKIYDLDKSLENRYPTTFKDGTKSGSDAQQFQVAYNTQRDSNGLKTLEDVGSQGNPVYKYVPSKMVDPIPTMNRALSRAINSTFMDDYKMYAVEHWLKEAAPYLKASESEIKSAPFYYFNASGDKGAYKSGADTSAVWNLMSNRYKINQFVGTPNKVDTWIHGLTQQLADKFYEKLGPEESRSAIGKAVSITPLWMLSKATDPISTIRSIAFNAKLGVFSLPQFLVQAQNFATILALEPRRAVSSMYATTLHTWARVNSSPEMLAHLDDYATRINMGSRWKPGEWTEARNELAKSGFEHVGGEYAMQADTLQHKFIKNDWNNFLDAGQVFFREGERTSRLGAYYAAFREFRDVNPTKLITDADRAAILNKADLLTVNMSRASASTLHGGVLSLSTQFLSYQLRMAELFFSKRIGETVAERTLARGRILGTYAALYGAPSAIGVTGYPFGESIRQYATNNGYVVGDSYMQSIMEGVPAWILSMATGNQYNIGARYGSQGFTVLNEMTKSDASLWKVIGGAGLNTIGNTLAKVSPFWQAAQALMSPDEEKNPFSIKPVDFVDLFSEVSTIDSGKRLYMAMNVGKWMSKNEAYIGDVSTANALFMTATGLKPQQQDDIFTLKNIRDHEESTQKEQIALITKDYRRAMQAVFDNDDTTAKDFFSRARARMIAAGIPHDRIAEVYAQASRGYESQIETSTRNWATKNVPAGQEQVREDAWSRILKLRNQ